MAAHPYEALLIAAGYTRHTSPEVSARFGHVCYVKDGADDINFSLSGGNLWADERDAFGTDAESLAEYLKPADPLDNFNYVGSRHHY